MRIDRAVLAIVVLAATTTACRGASAQTTTSRFVRYGGQGQNTVAVAVTPDGKHTAAEVRRNDPNGQLELLIPKGFPVAMLIPNLDNLGAQVAGPKGVAVHDTYDPDNGHWPSYEWGVAPAATARAYWVFDNFYVPEHSHWAQDWVGIVNGGVHAALVARGLSSDMSIMASYYRDTAYPCINGGSHYAHASLIIACDSSNIGLDCGGGAGCTYLAGAPTFHYAVNFQPNIRIADFITQGNGFGPWGARNVVDHEFIHATGLNHNLTNPCSLIYGDASACNGNNVPKDLTSADYDRLAAHYHHGVPE